MPNLDVRITSMYPPGSQGGTRAIASATIAGCFAVRGIKIVEGGKDGLFVSMPSRKTQDGYKDICFPVTAEFRKEQKENQGGNRNEEYQETVGKLSERNGYARLEGKKQA